MAIGICTPMVTVEDIVNGVKDEYGCRYTKDGKYLLKGCEGITSYTIKAGTEIIWDNAFYYFCLLEAVVIPESVMEIGSGAFAGCNSIQSIFVARGKAEYYKTLLGADLHCRIKEVE